MASPIIDEALIDHLLKTTPGTVEDATGRLAFGAEMLILNAFDRKVTRENFLDLLRKAINLVDGASRSAALKAVSRRPEHYQHPEIFHGVIKAINAEVTTRAKECIAWAELLSACPRDQDPVN